MDKQFNYDLTLEEMKARLTSLSKSEDKDKDGIPDQLEREKMMIDKAIAEKELKLKAREIEIKAQQVKKVNKAK